MTNKIILVVMFVVLQLGIIYVSFQEGKKSNIIEYIEVPTIKLPPIVIPIPETKETGNIKLPDEVYKDFYNSEKELTLNSTNKDSLFLLKNLLANKEKEIDSLKVLNAYKAINTYKGLEMYSSKEYGTFTTDIDIQFNKISKIYNSELTPVQKVIKEEKKYSPFLTLKYSTLDYANIGGGVINNKTKFGISYEYQKPFSNQKDGHLIGIIKSF